MIRYENKNENENEIDRSLRPACIYLDCLINME